jgi:hypothetical protein
MESVLGLEYARWRLVMSSIAPWLAIGLFFAAGVIVFEAGFRHGGYIERSIIANECRQAGAFTSKRSAFDCWVLKK